MAKKSGGGAIGAILLVAVGVLAAVPKEAWITIGVIAFGGWMLYLFFGSKGGSSSSSNQPPEGRFKSSDTRRPKQTPLAHTSRHAAPARFDHDEPVTVGRAAAPAPSFKIPDSPLPKGTGRWIPPGEAVTVAGTTIPGGMLYVGDSLPTLAGGDDPALINTKKSVANNGNYRERGFGYWPSYSEIPPGARRAYLNWLANGRKDPAADIGYVFLYFYGLERRAILEAPKDAAAQADWPLIAAELKRLLSIYGSNNSFSGYASKLLSWVSLSTYSSKLYLEPLPDYERSWELPLHLRLVLGQCALDKTAVPARVALAWARLDPNRYLRTPAIRCAEKFEHLFIRKYAEAFGDGMLLPVSKTKLKFVYTPASSGFHGYDTINLSFGDVPDITVLTSPLKKLQDLVEATTTDLEGYSRYVGRNPTESASLHALLLLPAPLWPKAVQERLSELKSRAERGMVVMKLSELLAAVGANGTVTKDKLAALVRALEAMRLGVDGLIVYVSPLKALINDQFGRLDRLCEALEIKVWPWHGDITSGVKARFLKKPEGVLLITPESLEAMLCNRGTSITAVFKGARFFVVDELHAFIGSERGKQLQSLMHRIDRAAGRSIPRIGLSATLGDMSLAGTFLRPGGAPALVESKSLGVELKILVKGYEEPSAIKQADGEEPDPVSPAQIAAHLFKVLRGSNNLIFPNSRREVERYTHILNSLCEREQVPSEFWPHHGSLSKEIRSETEAALKQKERPATAICTNTLELGIDIGAVKSVGQIGPPPSVASLRQRLGRAGRRRGEPAILRGYSVEDALPGLTSLKDRLRLDTLQITAMISLLLEGWFEPPQVKGAHFSTLIQQLLSVIAQSGGASAKELFSLLCAPGAPFAGVTTAEFLELLRHLGAKELIVQESSGVLLHGTLGEKFVNHYTFYAAFASDEEFRIVAGGRTLGTLPVNQLLTPGQRILFAGKTWRVEEVDDAQKTIYVTRASGGIPPLFSGGPGRTHTRVRQRLRDLLRGEDMPPFLDVTAQKFLGEARDEYARLDLDNEVALDQGHEVMLLTWLGDAANEAIACLFLRRGFTAMAAGPGVEVHKKGGSIGEVLDALGDFAVEDTPELDILLADVKNLAREKWDWALPDGLLRKAYASQYLDLTEAANWVKAVGQTRIGT